MPLRVGTPVTLVGALTIHGLQAVRSLDGALNAASFAVYLEQVLGPTLVPGDVVVLPARAPRGRHGRAGRGPQGPSAVFAALFARFCPHRAGLKQAQNGLAHGPGPYQRRPWNALWTKPSLGLPAKTRKIGLTIAAIMYTNHKTALN